MSPIASRLIRGVAIVAIVAAAAVIGLPGAALAQGTEITIVRNVAYRSVEGSSLALDAYLPPGPGPHAALIVIPGGKWVTGSKDEDTWLPTDLADLGYAAFPVDYRPATQAPFPAALEDVQAAVRFVRQHATRFDIDPRRIGAIGASAGGHLAALLATSGEGSTDVGARVRVAVSWSGPMDLERLLHNPRTDLVNVVRTFLGCTPTESCLAEARAASPLDHVDPTDGALYLGNGTEEIIPLEQATTMIAALKRADVPNQLVETIGHDHGFGAVHNDKFFTPAMAFLGTWIGGRGTNVPSPTSSGGKTGSPQPSVAPGVDQKGHGPETSRRRTETPWWAVAVTAVAVVAALISLILSLALFRRLRRAALLTSIDAQTADEAGSDTTDERLAARRTESPD